MYIEHFVPWSIACGTLMVSDRYTTMSNSLTCSQTVVTILKCSWDDSFRSLLLKFGCDDLEAETIHELIVLNDDKFIDPRHKVPIDAPVSVCDQFGN